MKHLSIAILLLFSVQFSFGQGATAKKYFIVTIHSAWNKTDKKFNYFINADPGIAGAGTGLSIKPCH